jgi:hypothetical protein
MSDNSNKVTVMFVADGTQYCYSATVSPTLEPFTSDEALITYDKLDDISNLNDYDFKGQIGPDGFALKVNNGPKIEGSLKAPRSKAVRSVDGHGMWEQS